MNNFEDDDVELTREMFAILLVLYESDPMPMSTDEIKEAIDAKGLLLMTDEEIEEYRRKLVEYKEYKNKAKWN